MYSKPFTRQVRPANRPAWTRMRSDLDQCLQGAGHWPEIVSKLLDEIERRPDAEVRVQAYVPNDVLLGLRCLIRTGRDEYLPRLLIGWKDSATTTLIGGILRWDGLTRVATPDQTVSAVFDDFLSYVVAQATGSLREFEAKLCELHGLSYDVMESGATSNAEKLVRVTLGNNGSLVRTPAQSNEPNARDFVEAHRGYLFELAALFDRNCMGLPD